MSSIYILLKSNPKYLPGCGPKPSKAKQKTMLKCPGRSAKCENKCFGQTKTGEKAMAEMSIF